MMNTDEHNPRTPDDPEAEFLAEMDAVVSGWPVRDGSDLLATATRVRHLVASDPRAQLDPARQQAIWERIVASQHTRVASDANSGAGKLAGPVGRATPGPPAQPPTARHTWRLSGWLATAVAICLLVLLAVPLVRELGSYTLTDTPTQLPPQTRGAALGSRGDDNIAGADQTLTPPAVAIASQVTPTVAPTQAVPPTDGGILAPPSTVIATMPANLTVAARVSVADPHELLFQLKQNNGMSYGWEDRYRTDPTGTRAYHAIPWTPAGDTDLGGSVGGVEIVQDGQDDRPLAGYIVFTRPEKAAQRLAEFEQTPGLVMAKTRVDQYDGIIVLNNDRVVTIVQIGNVLVIGSAWTDENDWASTEDDLQAFKWQSLKETVSAIAYLDHVVSAYQGHR